jgi:internalin A
MSQMTPEEQKAYDTAVARIAQAEREGKTELDLSGLGLTELPPEIGRLTGLRVLELWRNRLMVVPDSLRELTQLRYLYLSGNQLTAVPDWLGELTQLRSLDLNGNRLTAVPDSLCECEFQRNCIKTRKSSVTV